MSGDSTRVILKGSNCLGESFLDKRWRWRFVASNHTLLLTFHGVNHQEDCQAMIFCAES